MTNNGKSPWDPKDQPPDLDQLLRNGKKGLIHFLVDHQTEAHKEKDRQQLYSSY